MSRLAWLPRGSGLLAAVTFALLLGVNLLVMVGFTAPRAFRDRASRERLETLKTEHAQQKDLTSQMVRKASVIHANQVDQKRFYNETIAGPGGITAILENLEAMARDAGVQATRRSYKPSDVKGAGLVEFTITMPVAGTYAQVTDYLKRIESGEHFLVVNRLAMRGKNEPGGAADLDVVLKAYLLRPQGEKKNP